MIRYLSTADIGAWFGVTGAAISKWRQRYENFPEPDAVIGAVAGWLPEREQEIRDWEKTRPGQGAGGGRPPKPNHMREQTVSAFARGTSRR